MFPNAHNLPSVRTRLPHNVASPQEIKPYFEGSKRTQSSDRKPGARERVDDLEASIDVIDGLVTSLSDFAMRSQVC
jgi:thiamine monophosphate kinase